MDKKQEILAAAFELFSDKGYHLSMSELAGAVGIKTPSLYSHFRSKDQILEIIIDKEIQQFYANLKENMAIINKLRCEEGLKSIYNFVLTYFGEHKRLRFWRWIPLIASEPLRTVFSKLIAQKDSEFSQEMRLCFKKGQESGEIRGDIGFGSLKLFFCIIQGVLDGMLIHKSTRDEQAYSKEIFEAFWEGIRTKPEVQKG